MYDAVISSKEASWYKHTYVVAWYICISALWFGIREQYNSIPRGHDYDKIK